MKDHAAPPSTGTQRRGQLSRQPTDDSGVGGGGTHHSSGSGGGGAMSNHPLHPPNPKSRMMKQSSTESGHSTSNRMSLHSSSDATAHINTSNNRTSRQHGNESFRSGPEPPPGGQSWHGTPRTDTGRRGRGSRHANSGVDSTHSTTLPRRTGSGPTSDMQHRLQQDGGGSNSLDGTMVKQRRSAGGTAATSQGGETTYQTSTAIPLIEFHLVNGSPNNSAGMRGENFNSSSNLPANNIHASGDGSVPDEVFYQQSNRPNQNAIINHHTTPARAPMNQNRGGQQTSSSQNQKQPSNPNKAYIKYNSFANY